MTTDQLQGRDLDRAAAVAMGWTKPSTRGKCDVCGWPIVPEGEHGCWASRCTMVFERERPVRADECAPYSTDPARITEMLAWLRANSPDAHWVRIDTPVTGRGDEGDNDSLFHANLESATTRGNLHRDGTTLSEALARLVVAVGEAKQ